MVGCQHHSCVWYQNSRLYFTYRPFLPYPAQLPRWSFAKESKRNGTAAEAFCVWAAALLIRRWLNGAAVEFPRGAVGLGVFSHTREVLPWQRPRPELGLASAVRAPAPGAQPARPSDRGRDDEPSDTLSQKSSLPAPMDNFSCHPLRKPHG